MCRCFYVTASVIVILSVVINALLILYIYGDYLNDQASFKHDRIYYDRNGDYIPPPEPIFKSKLAKWFEPSTIKWILEKLGLGELIQFAGKISTIVSVPLDAILLPFEAIQSIHRWFNGEISGRRCAKTIIDASAVILGGAGGAVAGAVGVGMLGGGLAGAVLGGITGLLFGASAAHALTDNLTQRIFDLPKSIAVERAYQFLGETPSSRNFDINQAFRKLVRDFHPDVSPGDEDLFMELQSNMQLIKEDRKRTFRN